MSSRLLVVDDDAALNLAPCAHFEDRGWRATGVYDCAAAVAATAGANFEVVLLDVHLPDGDGVELLDRLLERDPHLPVILTTRGRDVERAMQAIAAGAFDWLPKPFEPAELERPVRIHGTRQGPVGHRGALYLAHHLCPALSPLPPADRNPDRDVGLALRPGQRDLADGWAGLQPERVRPVLRTGLAEREAEQDAWAIFTAARKATEAARFLEEKGGLRREEGEEEENGES